MNKSELIEALAGRLDGDKKAANAAIDAFVDLVFRSVAKGEKVSIAGFGVFEKRPRNARMARNPATGEPIKVKKTSVPAFRPGTKFKAVVSGQTKLGAAPRPIKVGGTKVAAKKVATPAKAGVKVAASKAAATKTTARKTTAKAAATKKTAAKKVATPAKKTAAKAPAKKTTARKAPARKR